MLDSFMCLAPSVEKKKPRWAVRSAGGGGGISNRLVGEGLMEKVTSEPRPKGSGREI